MNKEVEVNENLNKFYTDINKTLEALNNSESDLVLFSDDNSFPMFVRELVNKLARNIEEAILGKDTYTLKDNVVEDCPIVFDAVNELYRYTRVIDQNITYKIITQNIRNLFIRTNMLIENWLRLIEESNSFKEFKIEKKVSDGVLVSIRQINEILNMSMSIENLVSITSKLIIKAEEILTSTPRAFDISRSFAEALKKEME